MMARMRGGGAASSRFVDVFLAMMMAMPMLLLLISFPCAHGHGVVAALSPDEAAALRAGAANNAAEVWQQERDKGYERRYHERYGCYYEQQRQEQQVEEGYAGADDHDETLDDNDEGSDNWPQDDGYDDYNEPNYEHYNGYIYMSPEEEYYLQGIGNHNNLVV